MNWLRIALLIAIAPFGVAHSGTFLDDFSDGNLDGWDVQFSLEFTDSVRIEIDTLSWIRQPENEQGLLLPR